MESQFRGKKYLVTGAGSGIVRGLARQLTDLGAEVWGVSRTKENLQSLQEESSNFHGVPLDLTDWDTTRSTLQSLPTMDGLVNNAAVAICRPFFSVIPEDFDL